MDKPVQVAQPKPHGQSPHKSDSVPAGLAYHKMALLGSRSQLKKNSAYYKKIENTSTIPNKGYIQLWEEWCSRLTSCTWKGKAPIQLWSHLNSGLTFIMKCCSSFLKLKGLLYSYSVFHNFLWLLNSTCKLWVLQC